MDTAYYFYCIIFIIIKIIVHIIMDTEYYYYYIIFIIITITISLWTLNTIITISLSS